MGALAGLDNPVPGVIEESITIPAGDGYEIPTRIHKPETIPTEGTPLVVMYHGGGYCLGNPDGEALNCRAFVKHFGAVCVNVDYRLAPGKILSLFAWKRALSSKIRTSIPCRPK
jgi:acetyl esterase/lipase